MNEEVESVRAQCLAGAEELTAGLADKVSERQTSLVDEIGGAVEAFTGLLTESANGSIEKFSKARELAKSNLRDRFEQIKERVSTRMVEMIDTASSETDLDELVQTTLQELCETEGQGWDTLVEEINSRLADLNLDEDKTFETLAASQVFAFDTFAEHASSGLTALIEEQSE